MEYINQIFKTLHQFIINFMTLLPNIVIAILLLIVTHFIALICNKLIKHSLRRLRIRSNLVQVFQKIASIGIWIFGSLIACAIIFPSVTTGNLLTTLGLSTVALGLAFKSIFENFFSGILILLREPFRVGDFVVVKNQKGYVEKISVRNTHLRQSDGVRVVMPNAVLFNNPIQVLTDLDTRREQIDCSVDFVEDIEKVRKAIKKAIDKCETVSKENYIQIYVKSFSSNGIDFEIYWWTQSKPRDIRQSRDEVLTNIKKVLDHEGIKLSYTTTLSFFEPLAIIKGKKN